ncbi:MAG: XdhC/CoxI family protein [Chloroflexota bacterium]
MELRQHLHTVSDWLNQGRKVACAIVIQTWKSSPRQAGARLFVDDAYNVVGSVSAGCVETTVIEIAQDVIKTSIPQQLHFGVSNNDAISVGLACGGEIDIFVVCWQESLHSIISQLASKQTPFEIITNLDNGNHTILAENKTLYTDEPLQTHHAMNNYSRQVIKPPPQVIIVGGNHIAQALSQLAHTLSYDVILIDPRTTFANRVRFPQATRIINQYPQKALHNCRLDQQTALVVLSHDPKFDDPALIHALNNTIGYIGALGSQRTQAQRNQRLHNQGFNSQDVERIHGPIGLDIGAKSPPEIALAIMAEIVQAMSQHTTSPSLTVHQVNMEAQHATNN